MIVYAAVEKDEIWNKSIQSGLNILLSIWKINGYNNIFSTLSVFKILM